MASKAMIFAETLMLVGAVSGSLLLSLNIPESKWGYLLFLMSSISGVFVGRKAKVLSLTLMNFFFIMVNMTGVYRWIISAM